MPRADYLVIGAGGPGGCRPHTEESNGEDHLLQRERGVRC